MSKQEDSEEDQYDRERQQKEETVDTPRNGEPTEIDHSKFEFQMTC